MLHFARRIAPLFAVGALQLAAVSADAKAPPTEPTLTAHDAVACISDHAMLRAEVATVGGAPLVGRTVVFTLGGVEIGKQTSDAGGRVAVPYVVPEGSHVGANAITISVPGTTLRAIANLAVMKTATKIVLPISAAKQDIGTSGGKITMFAHVQRATDNTFLPKKIVKFTLEGRTASGATGDRMPSGGMIAAAGVVQLPPSMLGKATTWTAAFEGDADYLPSALAPQSIELQPVAPTPPPAFQYAIYPTTKDATVSLGSTIQLKAVVSLPTTGGDAFHVTPPAAHVPIQVQACLGQVGYSPCWPVGSGTTDAHGILVFEYKHETPVPPGSYAMQVGWVKGGQTFGGSSNVDPSYLKAPLVITNAGTKVTVTQPPSVAPGDTAHIVARVTRVADGQLVTGGVLWLYKTTKPDSDSFPGYGVVDPSGNGAFDLAIGADIPPGRHTFYLCFRAKQGTGYASSVLAPVVIDVVGRAASAK